MGSTESPPGRLTASMVDALVDSLLIQKYLLGPTTTSSPVVQYMLSIMPSCKQDLISVPEQPSTSQISRASSAPTSSNTQRLGGSLFLVEYKTIQGERTLTFAIKEDAVASFKELNGLYRIVTLSEEKTTTTTTVLRDSQNPGA